MSSRRTPAKRSRPASTPEGRENQLIALAYEVAEKQMRDGTAAAQVVTHFLKAGSSRDNLERRKIEQENLLLSAKIDALASSKRIEELYSEALEAMGIYSGRELGQRSYDEDEYDDYDPY